MHPAIVYPGQAATGEGLVIQGYTFGSAIHVEGVVYLDDIFGAEVLVGDGTFRPLGGYAGVDYQVASLHAQAQ